MGPRHSDFQKDYGDFTDFVFYIFLCFHFFSCKGLLGDWKMPGLLSWFSNERKSGRLFDLLPRYYQLQMVHF